MVLKKKNNKEEEVQQGWKGHVIPFELVQKIKFKEQLSEIKSKESRISEISSELEELLNELSEEDKERDFVNEEKDAFVSKEVTKAIKAKEIEPNTMLVLQKVDSLFKEEKRINKQIKDHKASLHLLTKQTIEGLSDEDALKLVEFKWVTSLVHDLSELPSTELTEFIGKLEVLSEKYETTLTEVEQQIRDTEKSLNDLLSDLTGSDYDMQGIAELQKLLGGE